VLAVAAHQRVQTSLGSRPPSSTALPAQSPGPPPCATSFRSLSSSSAPQAASRYTGLGCSSAFTCRRDGLQPSPLLSTPEATAAALRFFARRPMLVVVQCVSRTRTQGPAAAGCWGWGELICSGWLMRVECAGQLLQSGCRADLMGWSRSAHSPGTMPPHGAPHAWGLKKTEQ
jgi:hypothetical protein